MSHFSSVCIFSVVRTSVTIFVSVRRFFNKFLPAKDRKPARFTMTIAPVDVSARPASRAEAWLAMAYQPKRKVIPSAGCSTCSVPFAYVIFFLFSPSFVWKVSSSCPYTFLIEYALILSVLLTFVSTFCQLITDFFEAFFLFSKTT